jgi:hypothetical protein
MLSTERITPALVCAVIVAAAYWSVAAQSDEPQLGRDPVQDVILTEKP